MFFTPYFSSVSTIYKSQECKQDTVQNWELCFLQENFRRCDRKVLLIFYLSVHTVRDQLANFYSTCVSKRKEKTSILPAGWHHWDQGKVRRKLQFQPLRTEAQNIFVYVGLPGAPWTRDKTCVCVSEENNLGQVNTRKLCRVFVTIVQPSCNQGQCSQLQQTLVRQTW